MLEDEIYECPLTKEARGHWPWNLGLQSPSLIYLEILNMHLCEPLNFASQLLQQLIWQILWILILFFTELFSGMNFFRSLHKNHKIRFTNGNDWFQKNWITIFSNKLKNSLYELPSFNILVKSVSVKFNWILLHSQIER